MGSEAVFRHFSVFDPLIAYDNAANVETRVCSIFIILLDSTTDVEFNMNAGGDEACSVQLLMSQPLLREV